MTVTVQDNQVTVLVSGQQASITVTPQVATILVQPQVFNVYVQPRTADIITVGTQGPPGIPEEEMVYARKVNFVGSSVLYRGEAVPGSATNASVWRVRRITIAVDGDIDEQWANGNATFANVWDNHLVLSYS